jgi:hypothetical protein
MDDDALLAGVQALLQHETEERGTGGGSEARIAYHQMLAQVGDAC